ncbi:hypothetical protein TNCV_1793491 [Trichonephila clavipes]|nr:hypothetical protein TNCV_1793491 [Trichonephila clavipes]
MCYVTERFFAPSLGNILDFSSEWFDHLNLQDHRCGSPSSHCVRYPEPQEVLRRPYTNSLVASVASVESDAGLDATKDPPSGLTYTTPSRGSRILEGRLTQNAYHL